jgi:thiol-disulfide isomerase/thioredoxin
LTIELTIDMIIERFLVIILLSLAGVGAFQLMRLAHVRRLGRVSVTAGRPRLLYFRSDHCAACPTQARYLEQVTAAWQDALDLEWIDTDAEPEKAAQFGVFSLPTTIVVDGAGAVRQINYGLTSAGKLSAQLAPLAAEMV